MFRLRLIHSVLFRLVLGLVIGGLLMSAGLGVLRWRSAEEMLRIESTQRITASIRGAQAMLRTLMDSPTQSRIENALAGLTSDSGIVAARLTAPTLSAEPLDVGQWPRDDAPGLLSWRLPEAGAIGVEDLSLHQPTIVRAPFTCKGQRLELEILFDGPATRAHALWRVIGEVAVQWLLLGVVTLMGVLLLRRWVGGPLSEVVDLVAEHAGPESFYDLARRRRDEFGRLAEAVGGMLTRLDNTTQLLRTRERAFQSLYQFAPTAMVSVEPGGRILEANRRAAIILGVDWEQNLIGRDILDFVRPEDRGMLRQSFSRVELDNEARCEFRAVAADAGDHDAVPADRVTDRQVDLIVELAGVRDDDGHLHSVRLSLLDVSEAKRLHRELADKSHLLNLLIDHMSDAILLVDAEGRVAAHNQTLNALLHLRPNGLVGTMYSPEHTWEELGLLNHDLFVARMTQINADASRPAQEQFETRGGTFQFQGIPVHDAVGQNVGRLWVVRDATTQEQAQKLLEQQTGQLRSLKRMGRELAGVTDMDTLMLRAVAHLFEAMEVEAVGIALRCDERGQRSRQILHRGAGTYLLETNRALVQAVEKHLMPQLLTGHDASFWPDLPRSAAWSGAFNGAGLTCVAGVSMRGSADAQGVLWIARRGGERIERRHIYLLEVLAPVIAGRLEIAQVNERLRGLELTDPVTLLPNHAQLGMEIARLVHRPGHPWSVMLIKLDHFRRLNESLAHADADALLQRIATLLLQSTRKSCLIARMTGPVFAVLMPDTPRAGGAALAERLRAAIALEQVQLNDGSTINLTASIGVAQSPIDGIHGEQVLALASARVESARAQGCDRVVSEGPGESRAAG